MRCEKQLRQSCALNPSGLDSYQRSQVHGRCCTHCISQHLIQHLKEKQPWQQMFFHKSSSEVKRTEQVETHSLLISGMFTVCYWQTCFGLLYLACLHTFFFMPCLFPGIKAPSPWKDHYVVAVYLISNVLCIAYQNSEGGDEYLFFEQSSTFKMLKATAATAFTVQYIVEHGIAFNIKASCNCITYCNII